MDGKIWVRWVLKRNENKYYALDWSYEQLPGFEEEILNESTIKSLIEINDKNMEYLGYFESEAHLRFTLNSKAVIEDKQPQEFGNVEWKGPDFYLVWGTLGDPVVCNALEALDTEYDLQLENGNWLSWLTGWTSDMVDTTKDLKDCLMDIYNYDLDTAQEQQVEEVVLGVIPEEERDKDEDGDPKTEIMDDVNNIELGYVDVERVLKNAETLGRIDPATLVA